VLRLLYRDQSNENYVKAKEYFEKVDKEIKGLINKDKGKETSPNGSSKSGSS
jgi:hypothetical protein